MSVQSLENYNRRGTGWSTRRRTIAREDTRFLSPQNVEIRLRLRILANSRKHGFHEARRMMRNNEDAEDAAESRFTGLYHLRVQRDSRFSTWLSRHCLNAALMKLRKKHRLWNVSLDESAETKSRLPGSMSKTKA